MVCEISQPKKGPCENGPWLRNNFAAPRLCCEIAISQPHTPLCENFRSCEIPLWHTSAISQTPPHFGAAKCSTKSSTPKNSHFCSRTPISQPSTLILQLQNGLRKCQSTAKSTPCCEIDHPLRKGKASLCILFKCYKFLISFFTDHLNFK